VIVPAGPGIVPGALVDVIIERANTATLFGRVVDAGEISGVQVRA
jgi:hypothetical protein